MKKRLSKVLCAAVLGGTLAVTSVCVLTSQKINSRYV